MDAEIGVRDLADSFRYNVLPNIIDALGFTRDKLHGDIEVFEDLPEYEKLSMLVCKIIMKGLRPYLTMCNLVNSASRVELRSSLVFSASESQHD